MARDAGTEDQAAEQGGEGETGYTPIDVISGYLVWGKTS